MVWVGAAKMIRLQRSDCLGLYVVPYARRLLLLLAYSGLLDRYVITSFAWLDGYLIID